MKRITNYIGSTIMAFVALTLVLHPFITHHHHFETSSNEYCSCPIEASVEKNHSAKNHCHKFNDFNEDKKNVSAHRVLNNLFLSVINPITLSGLYELPLWGVVTEQVQPLCPHYFLDTATQRGPPSPVWA